MLNRKQKNVFHNLRRGDVVNKGQLYFTVIERPRLTRWDGKSVFRLPVRDDLGKVCILLEGEID